MRPILLVLVGVAAGVGVGPAVRLLRWLLCDPAGRRP